MSLKHLSSPYGKIKKIERIEKKQFPSPATERAIPTDGDIKENKLNLKADDLTENIYTIKSIFDITHGSNTPDIPSVAPIPLQSDTLLFSRDVNVTKAGGYNNLDIRANRQDGLRIGIKNSREPYIVKPIAKSGKNSIKPGYDRDLFPGNATLDDLKRFGKFYTSGKGLISLLKENTTNVLIGDTEFFQLPPSPFASIMAPPIPVPNTGFINFYQQSIQGAFNGSIRKPFKIGYSVKAGTIPGYAFAVQGDSTFGVKAIQKIKIFEGKNFATKLVEKGLRKLKNTAIIKLEEAAQIPKIEKPTSFIGTGASKPVDKISRKAIETATEDESTTIFNYGDFYVRIKDLRGQSDDDYKLLYFRGFVTGINENITPSWNPTQYIGRSEDVYVYQKAERDLSFGLKVYPQNETEFQLQYDKIDRLTSLAYPSYLDTEGRAFTRMQAPFTELYMGHVGSQAQGQFGFIKSLTYTVPENGDWDAYSALPRMFDIAITYQIINRRPSQLGTSFYKSHGEYTG